MKFSPLLVGASPIAALAVTQLFQFSNTSQAIENIAVRRNGHLLLNTFDNGYMYTLDPFAENPIPQVIAQIPESTGLTGIWEVGKDLYAVSAGVANATDSTFEPGTAKIALVNVSDSRGSKLAAVSVIGTVPDAGILNGLTGLPNPKYKHIILSSDSKTGRIYRVDTQKGTVDIVFQDDRLTPGPNPQLVPVGVNGIKIFQGYLYLAISEHRTIARVRIDDAGNKLGDLDVFLTLPPDPPLFPDDFSIAGDGTFYLATRPNALSTITPNGTWINLIEGDSAGIYLDGPTSSALSKDEQTLYITTGFGDHSGKGGQIVAVHL
ncbi:hypothetical protein NHJ13051_009766 [Beauveria bassiana]